MVVMNKKMLSPAQAMLLPDCCFGRRWPIYVTATGQNGNFAADISELAFPEVFVIWEVGFWPKLTYTQLLWFKLVMGDQLPTSSMQMWDLESLLPGVGEQGRSPREIKVGGQVPYFLRRLRILKTAVGKRLILGVMPNVAVAAGAAAVVVVSSVPKEVPDWLNSGPGKSQW